MMCGVCDGGGPTEPTHAVGFCGDHTLKRKLICVCHLAMRVWRMQKKAVEEKLPFRGI